MARLAAAEVAWIVTVRPDGRPHATPMVPIVLDGEVYFQTGMAEVKYANLQTDPRVLVLAGDTQWDDGLDVAVEGAVVRVAETNLLRQVAALFRNQWDGRWRLDVRADVVHYVDRKNPAVVFRVRPDKAFSHSKGDPFGQTSYHP